MIALEDTAAYLHGRGLLDPRDVTDGKLVIRDVSRRNRNYRVEFGSRPLLIKQGVDAESRATVSYEARLCRALRTDPRSAPYVPEPVLFDDDKAVLALELITPSQTLNDYHRRRTSCPLSVATALGRAFAALHLSARQVLHTYAEMVGPIPLQKYQLHRPTLEVFRTCTAGQLAVLRTIQATEGLPAAVDELGSAKLGNSTLLHADVKWDNLLLVRESRHMRVRLVDWEAATWGSALWDVGAVIASYLTWWVLSIPVVTGKGPEQLIRLAQVPFDRIRPAIGAFWDAYSQRSCATITDRHSAAVHATRLAGYRLLTTAYELTQRSERLSSAAVLHLQLGSNLLLRPTDGAARFLGITTRLNGR